MRTLEVSLPELAFVAATRGMAGLGIGLLVSEWLKDRKARRILGCTLLAVGVVTTVPIAVTVFTRQRTLRDAPVTAPE